MHWSGKNLELQWHPFHVCHAFRVLRTEKESSVFNRLRVLQNLLNGLRSMNVCYYGTSSVNFVLPFTGHHANQRAANIQSDKQKGNPRNKYIEGEALQFLIIIKQYITVQHLNCSYFCYLWDRSWFAWGLEDFWLKAIKFRWSPL